MKKNLKKLLTITVICSSLFATGCLNSKGNSSTENVTENTSKNDNDIFNKYITYTNNNISNKDYTLEYKLTTTENNTTHKERVELTTNKDSIFIYQKDNQNNITYSHSIKNKGGYSGKIEIMPFESKPTYIWPSEPNNQENCPIKALYDKYILNGNPLINIHSLTKIGLQDLTFKNKNLDYVKTTIVGEFKELIIKDSKAELKISENYNQTINNVVLDFTINGKINDENQNDNLNEKIEYKLIANQSGLNKIEYKSTIYKTNIETPIKTSTGIVKIINSFSDTISYNIQHHQ